MNVASTLVGQVSNPENQPDLDGNMFPVADEVDVASLRVTG